MYMNDHVVLSGNFRIILQHCLTIVGSAVRQQQSNSLPAGFIVRCIYESFAKTTYIELINAFANVVICSSAADLAADLYVRRIAIPYNSAANSFPCTVQ